jgi:hypothetical protein
MSGNDRPRGPHGRLPADLASHELLLCVIETGRAGAPNATQGDLAVRRCRLIDPAHVAAFKARARVIGLRTLAW